MDRYSIFAASASPAPEPERSKAEESSKAGSAEAIRFPADDGGQSLSAMAQRDLRATLQLLTERAQYITGASGAAIALRDGGEMICRASAGPSAPELGAHLQVDSGLSGESVRSKQILRCDDAEIDPRVNRESCRALGISSVMVMPLVREDTVMGVFELFSGRVGAFEERDIVALQRIADMIMTAVEHAEAATTTEKRIAATDEELAVEVEVQKAVETKEKPAQELSALSAPDVHPPEEKAVPAEASALSAPSAERLSIRKCEKCGFPVSEGRTLCLDCESSDTTPAPPYSAEALPEENWLRSHWYIMAIMVVLALVVGFLLRSR